MSHATQGYLPHQAAIESYGGQGFRFSGMSHKGSLLLLPDGVYGWDVQNIEQITLETLKMIFEKSDAIDYCIIGMGQDIAALPQDLKNSFKEHGLKVEALSTGAAVRTYNIMLSEERSVACALIAV